MRCAGWMIWGLALGVLTSSVFAMGAGIDELVAEGDAALAAGQYESAVAAYEQALGQAKDFGLKPLYPHEFRLAKALWARAVRDSELEAAQRMALLGRGDALGEGAIEAAKRARDEAASDYLTGYGEARVLGALGLEAWSEKERAARLKAGVASLEAAVQLDPENLRARELYCEYLWQFLGAGDRDRFIDEIDELIARQRDDHQPWARRAAALGMGGEGSSRKHDRQIVADFEKAIELSKGQEADYWIHLALHHERMGRPEEARETFVAGIRTFPVSSKLRAGYAMFLVRERKFEEAVSVLKQAISGASTDPVGYLGLARLYIMKQQPRDALPLLRKAESLAPEDETPRVLEAQCYMLMRKSAEAAKAYGEAAKLVRQQLSALPLEIETIRQHLLLERQLEAMGIEQCHMWLDAASMEKNESRRDELVGRAREVLGTYPAEKRHHIGWEAVLGRIDLLYGEKQDARKRFEAVVKQLGSGADRRTVMLLASLYVHEKQYEAAADLLAEACDGSDDPAMLTLYAQVLAQMKQWEEAKGVVEQVLRIDRRYGPARKLRSQIERELKRK